MAWYEWRDEGGPRKQKYIFSHASSSPFLMAAIGFSSESGLQLVTLTTQSTELCQPFHHRMPLLVQTELAMDWLETDNQDTLDHMLLRGYQDQVKYVKVG